MISIITPTYNRADLLKRAYESLVSQTCYDFEWIIIDDGSTDNTCEVVGQFDSSKFPILYHYKDNGGKHTALNCSHQLINGEYVLILDSDDYLMDFAIHEIEKGWDKYKDNEEIGMVVFLKGNESKQPLCYAKDENVPVDIMRYKRTYVLSSDCCEVIRADIFEDNPFPVFEGERFLAEGALWNRVSKTHKCIYINHVVYITEYLEDGLTKLGRGMRIQNPLGGMYNANLCMNKKNYIGRRFKNGLLYTCYGFFAKMTPMQMSKASDSKFIMWVCIPFGFALYKLWDYRYGK